MTARLDSSSTYSENGAPMSQDRTAQLSDDVVITLRLPASTEEWADELLAECYGTEVERLDDGLIATYEVGGNCNGITCLRMWLDDVEDVLSDGNIDPMAFTVEVTSKARDER